MNTRTQEDATLLDVLIDGFEKNEIVDGFHWRDLPMPDEAAAVRKYEALSAEGRKWKGDPTSERAAGGCRMVAWSDMQILQAGQGIRVRVRAPWFTGWWHAEETWQGDVMGPVWDWCDELDRETGEVDR